MQTKKLKIVQSHACQNKVFSIIIPTIIIQLIFYVYLVIITINYHVLSSPIHKTTREKGFFFKTKCLFLMFTLVK